MKVSKGLQGFKLKGAVMLMMALSGGMFTHLAQANTSAGTVLRNTATVNYKDVNNAAQAPASSSVDITVNLVPVVVWGAPPANQTVDSGQTLPTAYTTTLTNLGNGSDTYTIGNTITQSCTSGTLGVGSFVNATSVTLGAAVSSGAGIYDSGTTNTTIPVSNLVAADFAAGDKVKIGANIYTVVSVSADGDATTADSLVVTGGNAVVDVGAAGVQIGEQYTYSYAGTAGSTTGTGCKHIHTLTATGTLAVLATGNAQATDTSGTWNTLVNSTVVLNIVKYVRNATSSDRNPTSVSPSDIVYPVSGGSPSTYYRLGVTGNPGDTMEYLVVITNSGAGTAKDVKFTDTLPAFTTYQPTLPLGVDTDGDETFETTLVGGVETGSPNAIVDQTGSNITVYAGVGGDKATPIGGSVAGTKKTAIKFSIKID